MPETEELSKDDDAVECRVNYTAVSKTKWEADCPCGFWTSGTKEECRHRANGHPPRRVS